MAKPTIDQMIDELIVQLEGGDMTTPTIRKMYALMMKDYDLSHPSNTSLKSKRIPKCPRCDEPIPSEKFAGQFPGAISRRDNKTEICSLCGQAEAFEDAHMISEYTGPTYWQ